MSNIITIDLDNHTSYDSIIHAVDCAVVGRTMAKNRYNQTKTAEDLGLNRGTLRKKLKAAGYFNTDIVEQNNNG